jgi:putative FmdB family regulatory protein
MSPIYDLACPKCGKELVNVRRTIAEIVEGVKCPKCGKVMEIVPGAVPTIFRGSGWTPKGSTK